MPETVSPAASSWSDPWGALDDPEIEQLIEQTPHVSLEEILENRRFPEARKLYLDRFLGVYGHDPFLVRLLIESGRFLVYHPGCRPRRRAGSRPPRDMVHRRAP